MRISAIVPTLNEAERITALVARLLALGFCEVIVVDAGRDETAERAAAAGARVLRAEKPGRGAQLALGSENARGAILFFIHADCEPPEHAPALIRTALGRPGVIGGCFRLAFDDAHPLLALYAWLSRINHPLSSFGDQGVFVTARAYRAIGGYRPLPLLEDLDIQFRLRRAGRLVKLKPAMRTSARRFRANGALRQQAKNAAIVTLFLLGVNAHRLARWYRAGRTT